MTSRQVPEFRWRAVAFIMDGTGAYLLATVFIIIAGVQFSHAFHEQDRIRRIFQALVFERAEPYRDEEYAVANAALVLHLEEDDHTLCGFASRDDASLRPDLELLQRFRDYAQALLPATLQQCPRPASPSVATPDSARLAAPTAPAPLAPVAVHAPSTTPDPHTAPTAPAVAPGPADAGVAPAVAPVMTPDLGDYRIRPALGSCTTELAATIEALTTGNWVPFETSTADRLRVKLYFISSTGVSLLPSRTAANIDPGHPLEGASYVREILHGHTTSCQIGDRTFAITHTRPYRDISGDGIVQTICMPVGPDEAPTGAACMDRTTTMAGRLKRALGRLDRLFAVRAVILDKATRTVSRCETGCVADEASPWLLNSIQRDVTGDATWWPRADKAARKITISKDFEVLLIPATPRDTTAGTTQAIVLVPRDAEVIALPRLLLGLLMLVIAAALVFRSTARQRERERLRTLHGLPTPVVVTRGTRQQPTAPWRHRLLRWVGQRLGIVLGPLPENLPAANAGEILFANAAAESLLGARLPRFPRQTRIGFLTRGVERDKPRYFTEWLHGNDLTLYERETAKRHTFEASEYELHLSLGNTHCRVRVKGEWLRRANGDMDSFGVLEVISEKQP